MTPLFSSLYDSLKVSPADNDHVEVTVILPDSIFRDYLNLFDAMTGFVRVTNRHTKLNRSRQSEVVSFLHQEAISTRDRYYDRIVKSYDLCIDQGLNRTKAIKQISTDLRKENHPWSSPDLVRSSLVAAGRPWRKL